MAGEKVTDPDPDPDRECEGEDLLDRGLSVIVLPSLLLPPLSKRPLTFLSAASSASSLARSSAMLPDRLGLRRDLSLLKGLGSPAKGIRGCFTSILLCICIGGGGKEGVDNKGLYS